MGWIFLGLLGVAGAWLYGAKLVATNAPPLAGGQGSPTVAPIAPGDFVLINVADAGIEPAVRQAITINLANAPTVRAQVSVNPSPFPNLVAVSIADPRIPPSPFPESNLFGVPLSSLTKTS